MPTRNTLTNSTHNSLKRRGTATKRTTTMVLCWVAIISIRPVRAWTMTTAKRNSLARLVVAPINAIGAVPQPLLNSVTARSFSTAPQYARRHDGNNYNYDESNSSAGRRPASYSLDDVRAVMKEREVPPVLDGYAEEEGYGAYDYRPELYEEDEPYDEGGSSSSVTRTNNNSNAGGGESLLSIPVIPDDMLAQEPVRDDDDGMSSQTISRIVSSKKESTKVSSSSVPISKEDTPLGEPKSASPFAGLESVLAPLSDTPSSFDSSPSLPATFLESSPSPEHVHAANAAVNDVKRDDFLTKSASWGTSSSELDDLKDVQLPELERKIYQQNNGREFNINSHKQVSQVLFGISDKSTNKDVLEGMAAGGNRMADLILQFRSIKNTIKKLERRAENTVKGTYVRSVSTVSRPKTNVTADATTDEESDPLLLVDASSYIFRAYYSMPAIHRSDGMPTGAVMGFCSMINRLILNRLLDGEQPRIILAFDAKGSSFRKDLYPAYKANRPAAPIDLIPQFDLIRQASAAYGIPIVEAPSFEADDVIATLAVAAQAQGLDVHIMSGDKDLMQLITGPDVLPVINMIDPMSMSRIAYDQVVEKWGVGPHQLGDVLALAGDSADNVPGVPGIGPKTASALLNEYKTLERLLASAAEIKQKSRREKLIEFADQARLSRALVDLEDNIPGLPRDNLSACRTEPFDADRILAFYDEMGFKEVKRRFQNQLQRGTPRKRPKSNKREKVDIPEPEDFADVPF